MPEAVILEAIRTPFAKRGGAFREQRPDALLASLFGPLVERSGVDPAQVEDVVTGCVLAGGRAGRERGASRVAARRNAGGDSGAHV
jgi:acetyl-CoA acetyltransferase